MLFLQDRNMFRRLLALLFVASCMVTVVPAGATDEAILPPELSWDGASRALMAPADHAWITPAEVSGLTRTPSYDETFAWLDRLVQASPAVQKISLGRSQEGRDLWMILASADGAFTPEAMRATGKPLLLAHAGIHSGEIDGKDAGLMLLRDMTVRGTRSDLLDRVNLLFIPILNVDGHERSSRFGRINQRGPEQMGWRTNARNQNLNRDFAKLDTPGVRALVQVFNDWRPDLYVDLHVTDGADYQYDITWGFNGDHAYSPRTARWLEDRLGAAANRDLKAQGHVPGPLIFLVEPRDPDQGMFEWTAGPRFSTGYGDLRHLPSVLVENHSLKPYDQRVLGTYVFLESALRTLAQHFEELRSAVQEDRSRRATPVPLAWKVPDAEPAMVELLGIESRLDTSPVSGGVHLEYTGKPVTLHIPLLRATEPAVQVERPVAYWIPAQWPEVIERLELHGIRMERTTEWRELEVEMYRVEDAGLEADPFEGHARVTGTPQPERRRQRFAPGSVRIPTDQALGDLAVVLLEPASPDSFYRWGFFLETLQRAEYVEEYVMEPMARRMLQEDPELAAEFHRKLLKDSDFAGSERDRLQWFYRRTPFFDDQWKLYPVAREMGK
ncbi:MAG: carboxypeptidase [Acidobacteria bacterium]|nr:MAG: carboxypeptidase [Acidobacteriota bacterium]